MTEKDRECIERDEQVEGNRTLSNFQEIEVEIKGLVAANKMLMDYQKESRRDKKWLYKIVIGLVAAMLIEAGLFIGAFCWYESQYEVIDTVTKTVTTETTESNKDMTVSGENAEINNVEGDQYNDDATHNDGE